MKHSEKMVKYLFFSLVLVSSTSFAESVENWKIKITDEYKNYSTTYIDGSEFGITCKSICFYYLIQKQNCIQGSEDLTLMSNSIGDTLLVSNKCIEQNNISFYIFDDFTEITNLFRNENIAQFINDLNRNKKNRVTTYSILGFKSVIEKYFTPQSSE